MFLASPAGQKLKAGLLNNILQYQQGCLRKAEAEMNGDLYAGKALGFLEGVGLWDTYVMAEIFDRQEGEEEQSWMEN